MSRVKRVAFAACATAAALAWSVRAGLSSYQRWPAGYYLYTPSTVCGPRTNSFAAGFLFSVLGFIALALAVAACARMMAAARRWPAVRQPAMGLASSCLWTAAILAVVCLLSPLAEDLLPVETLPQCAAKPG